MSLTDVRSDIEASVEEPDYTAVDTLWLALLKLANEQASQNERVRMEDLVRSIPVDEARVIVNQPSVDKLLNLDPPLETVLVSQHERGDPEGIQEAIDEVRANRANDPTSALIKLGWLLKRIRDKRAHGFKTRYGARDSVILREARKLLEALCRSALAHAVIS